MLAGYYQDIYDWISPFNKPSGLWFYNPTVWWKLVWYIWSLAYFHFFEALNNAFEVQFFMA